MRAASKDTDPAPTMTCSALTENRVARCSRRVSAVASGYRLSWAALSATACSTDGSGGKGVSLLEGLKPAVGARRPCRYGGNAAISERKITEGVGSDTVIVPPYRVCGCWGQIHQ